MEDSKLVDILGLQKGWTLEQADAEQAYTQAKLGGATTYVRLPIEAYIGHPEYDKICKMRDPVCPLELALYGHPDSGDFGKNTVNT